MERSGVRHGLLLGMAVGWCAVSSCGSRPERPEALTIRDSAGVEIVEFDLEQVPPLGSVELKPEWVFGASPANPGGFPLLNVTDALILSDDRIAVVNWSTQEILLVDPDGRNWERLTKAGDGPGELHFIQSVSEEAGTIGVFDASLRRWLKYREGEFVESAKAPEIGTPGLYFPESVLLDGGGLVIADAYVPPGSPAGVPIRRDVLIARVDEGRVDTIAMGPADTGVDKITGISPFPWGASYGFAVSEAGVWLGNTDVPEVREWSRTGELRRVVRWSSSKDRRLTRRIIHGYRDRITEGRPREVQATIRRNFRETDFPDAIPAWGGVISSTEGVLWVSDYPGPAAIGPFHDPYPALQWVGIDSTGRPMGTLLTPEGLQATAFGADFLVGIHKDSLGVETVRRYRIADVFDGPSAGGDVQ